MSILSRRQHPDPEPEPGTTHAEPDTRGELEAARRRIEAEPDELREEIVPVAELHAAVERAMTTHHATESDTAPKARRTRSRTATADKPDADGAPATTTDAADPDAPPADPTRTKVPTTYRCELDGWEFDSRYTEGKCPICGWTPEGAPHAPRWLELSRKVEWDLVGLLVLFMVLVFVGVVVAQANGIRIPVPGQH